MGCLVRLGVGSRLGRGEGGGAGAAATQCSYPRRWGNHCSRGRAVESASPASTRASARARPARPRTAAPRALPFLSSLRAVPAGARRACGRGPGVRRRPRRGPAPRPRRMRPGVARELNRAPAPDPADPGLRSRSRRSAAARHDFQTAFRLDSLQVRGCWSHIPLLRASVRVEGAGPQAGATFSI